LQPATDAAFRSDWDDSRKFLFLQHDGGNRSNDRNSPFRRAFLFMTTEIEELYQEVILDHSRRPRNFGELADAAVRVHGDNPACGDEIHLGVKFDASSGLEDIKFTGHGCAISQASASLMTMKLKGKSRTEVMEMLRAFHDLVTEESSEAPKTLGDLRVMKGVRKFPQRVKCAMLAWRAVEQAMEQRAGEATVSTEPA
jgi:nitrogen fixation NifU-like protein